MDVGQLAGKIPDVVVEILSKDGIKALRPSQEKSVKAGLLDGKSVLVTTPTASGKTLVAELVSTKTILEKRRKAIYIVPLVALANEKYHEFKRRYGDLFSVMLTVGDLDSPERGLGNADLIVCTAEKLDSLLRHHVPWISEVAVVVIDEIHLLNDQSRGPTLEILITLLRSIHKNLQIVGLSATIGNPNELAKWLGATLVSDTWRPVELRKGVYHDGVIGFSDS